MPGVANNSPAYCRTSLVLGNAARADFLEGMSREQWKYSMPGVAKDFPPTVGPLWDTEWGAKESQQAARRQHQQHPRKNKGLSVSFYSAPWTNGDGQKISANRS